MLPPTIDELTQCGRVRAFTGESPVELLPQDDRPVAGGLELIDVGDLRQFLRAKDAEGPLAGLDDPVKIPDRAARFPFSAGGEQESSALGEAGGLEAESESAK